MDFAETIHLQCGVGDYLAVAKILEEDPDKAHTTNGRLTVPPLFYATRYGHLHVCQVLVAYGADVNFQDQGWTCLHEACARDHVDIAAFLLSRRVDPNTSMHYSGMTSLMHAARRNFHSMCTLLLHHGADVWQRNLEGKTAWHFAAEPECRDLLERSMRREVLWKAWACHNRWILESYITKRRPLPSVSVSPSLPLVQCLVEQVPYDIFLECLEYL